MSRITRKYEAVDLMKLYSQGSHVGWNEFLESALKAGDINRLARMRYALQAGMDDLTKLKMNNEKMILFYVRLMRSVEKTADKILRKKHPMPHDNPLAKSLDGELSLKAKRAKKKRDHEFQLFLMNSSY